MKRPEVKDKRYDLPAGGFNDELWSEDNGKYIDQLEAQKKKLSWAIASKIQGLAVKDVSGHLYWHQFELLARRHLKPTE